MQGYRRDRVDSSCNIKVKGESMAHETVTALDRFLARVCENCPACRQAQKQQAGVAYWLVTNVEVKVCPFCRAYERVHGKKAHESRD